MRISGRVPDLLAPNSLSRARTAAAGDLLDLTLSNPTEAGFAYPDDLLRPLANPRGLLYQPDPRGPVTAREAVADWYRRRGRAVDPDRVILTGSTSEAYSLLFKLFGDPGDEILVPAPSYPLFEHLVRAEGLRTLPFPLAADSGWAPDDLCLRLAPASVKAAVVVHPNNPTGSAVGGSAREALLDTAAERGIPLIVDEVFLPFSLADDGAPLLSFAGETRGMVATLGGLSKAIGLPQVKLAWCVLSAGDPATLDTVQDGLEFLADTYLSVATPTAEALPEFLMAGRTIQDQILARCRSNLEVLRAEVSRQPGIELLPPAGGWSVALRYPHVRDEETVCLDLIQRHGVAVHPGYFFDFPNAGWLVISLLPPPSTFVPAVEILLREVGRLS